MWERKSGSGASDAAAPGSEGGVAPGRRPLTAGLPEKGEAGWAAWREGDGHGVRLRFPWGAELPTGREAMRGEVERHWAGGGRVRAQTWLLHIEVLSGTPEGAPVRSDGAAVEAGEVAAALAMAREEIEAVTGAERAFQQRFERAGRALTGEMLAGSEAVVRGSLAGYGIELGPVLEKAIEKEGRTAQEIGLDVLGNPLEPLGQAMVAQSPALHAGAERDTASRAELAAAAEDLRSRAAQLAEANAENDRLQVEIQRRRGGTCHTAHRGGRADRPDVSHLAGFPAPELRFHGRRVPAAADEPGLDVQALGSARRVERLTAALKDAWREHETRHPVLAAYRDRGGTPTEELGRLAGGRDERHRELLRVSFERLCAIAKARQAVTSGAVSVLELPRVVDGTRRRLGVEPGSIQDAFIGNAVADASDPDWMVWVVSALSFASAILLAPATAGSSAALVLDIGFLTADVWLAIDAAADHTFAAAAALTDYDPARALGDEAPSVAALVATVAAAGASLLPIAAGTRALGSSRGGERPLNPALIGDLENSHEAQGASRFAFGSLGDEATSPELGRTKAGIASHLEQFRDGASYLLPESSYHGRVAGKRAVGRADGLYVTTRSAMDELLASAAGDLATVKKRLGIEPDEWNERLWRVDVANPLLHNARLPSGMEKGANDLFIWGGYTRGGTPEAVLDPVRQGEFVAFPTEVKP